jgi:hypothetical protein
MESLGYRSTSSVVSMPGLDPVLLFTPAMQGQNAPESLV